MDKSKARDLAKEATWRRRLARQADSGQSVRAWCREHRVTETAFYWWRRELARRDAEQPSVRPRDAEQASARRPMHPRDAEQRPVRPRKEEPASSARRVAKRRTASFVPVHVTDAPASDADPHIEIVLTDGPRVRVAGTVSRETLTMVLDVLTSANSLPSAHAGAKTVDPERRAC